MLTPSGHQHVGTAGAILVCQGHWTSGPNSHQQRQAKTVFSAEMVRSGRLASYLKYAATETDKS